jgi:hypothetical protein
MTLPRDTDRVSAVFEMKRHSANDQVTPLHGYVTEHRDAAPIGPPLENVHLSDAIDWWS